MFSALALCLPTDATLKSRLRGWAVARFCVAETASATNRGGSSGNIDDMQRKDGHDATTIAIEQMAFPMPQPVSDVAQACSPRTQDFLTVVGVHPRMQTLTCPSMTFGLVGGA